MRTQYVCFCLPPLRKNVVCSCLPLKKMYTPVKKKEINMHLKSILANAKK